MTKLLQGLGIVVVGLSVLGCDAPDAAPDDRGDIADRGLYACGYRTQNQSDWGATCDPSDQDSAACMRDQYFSEFFYEGLMIGCGELTANLVNSKAVAVALPTGGIARKLTPAEAVGYDGAGDPKVGTVFFGHVAALALNLAFDELDAWNAFHPAGKPLATVTVADPNSPCVGMTIEDVLTAANEALGGCPTTLTAAQLSSCVAQINNAWRDGYDPNNGGQICDGRFDQAPPS